jgi:hypothetical protein
MLKILCVIFLAADLYIGTRFLLNIVGILDTSKYGRAATALYAVLFLALGLTGGYYLFFTPQLNLAVWLSLAPWAIMLIVMFLVMATSRYP